MARAVASGGSPAAQLLNGARRALELALLATVYWHAHRYIVTTLAGTRLARTASAPLELEGCLEGLQQTIGDRVDVSRLWEIHSGVRADPAALREENEEGPYACKCRRPAAHRGKRPRVTAVVQSFNHLANVANISGALSAVFDEIVICEDGSSDGSLSAWGNALRRPQDVLIRSNNLHELRSYNRALRLADGEFVVLLQDDDLPPTSSKWLEDGLALMAAYPHLGVLGGFTGQLWTHSPYRGFEFGEQRSTHGGIRSGRTDRIPYVDPNSDMPFMFVECAWIGPLIIRSSLVRKAGGLNLDVSRAGEPGVWQDCVFSMEAWVHGYGVGIYHAPFTRGVGGHGSSASEEKRRLRERVFARALALANRRFKRKHIHNVVVRWNEKLLRRREHHA